MNRMRLSKKEYRRSLHGTHRVRRSSRYDRSANSSICIPIFYPSVNPKYFSPPLRVSNSAGATPVRGSECEIKFQSPYSPELPRPPSANSVEYTPTGKLSDAGPVFSPPGPPASPVPSPSGECCFAPPPSPPSTSPNPYIRVKLRKRRNAICSQTPMGKGLRDFLVSYIVSHLTDSMTSSLNLTSSSSTTRTAAAMMDADDSEQQPQQADPVFPEASDSTTTM
ncbi:unnamed protein product [Hymenolepis diminuta]|uniref:Uncharacterized protein n=2 Tax=Hymenolepis diminuta TaxID=6216 RepID=A0A564YMY1_HYMDI|nr:unnamed protein product [Hymenolepis diminuta]